MTSLAFLFQEHVTLMSRAKRAGVDYVLPYYCLVVGAFIALKVSLPGGILYCRLSNHEEAILAA